MRLNNDAAALILCVAMFLLSETSSTAQIRKVEGYPRFNHYGEHISFPNAKTGIVAGKQFGGETLSTRDSGATWSIYSVDSLKSRAGTLNSITVDSTGYGWCVGEKVAMFTTNNGTSWKQIGYKSTDSIAVELSKVILNDVCTIGDSMVWIAGGMIHLLFSSDRGATWSRIPCYNDSDGVALSVQFVTRTHGWVVFKRSMRLYETNDGGSSWTRIGDDRTFRDVQMVNDSLGWGSSNRSLVKTTDGGKTWNVLFRDPLEFELVLTHYRGNRVWCAPLDWASPGRTVHVYSSTDGGVKWDTLRGTKNYGYREICAADSNTVYGIVDDELYRINYNPEVDTTTAINDVSDGARFINVHFDGVAERLRISGFEPIRRIMVFNVVGDIVADAEATDGTLATELQTDTIPNGMYYLRFHVGARWYTTGIVLTR